MRQLFGWLAILVSLLIAPHAMAAEPAQTVAYVDAHWWTGAGFTDGARYVRDGLFVDRPRQGPDRSIDLDGAYVTPPFADAHNHMAGRTGEVSDKAMAAGVFYLMNPTVLASLADGARATLAGPGHVDAVLSMGAITAPGGHPEGLYQDVLRKYVYPDKRPEDFVGDAFHYVSTAADIEPVLDRLVAQHAQFVKIVLMFSEEFDKRRDDPAFREQKGLDPRLVPLIVRAAHRRGLRVAAHIETAADFRVIVAAGVDESAHMPGYYGGTGPLAQYQLTDADARAAARAKIRLVATASFALNNPDPARRNAVRAMQRANLLALKRAGVPILIGTDGAPDAALGEARYLIELGVFTPREALIALTETTPRWILPGRRIGALRPGYEASFLALKADPTRDFQAVSTIARRVKQGFDVPPPPAVAASPPPNLAIVHVGVISMTDAHLASDQTILIAGDRIAAVGAGLAVPPGVTTIDGHGRFAIPGLWDMHVHVLTSAPAPASVATLSAMLANGVVGVRDMGSTTAQLQDFRAAAKAASEPLPEVVAAGPIVNGPPTPWSRPIEEHISSPAQAEPVVARLAAGGSQFIKVYSGLDPQSYAAVVAAAHQRGLVVAGHLPFALDLDTVLAAGQRSVEHMEVHLSKSCGQVAPAKAADLWVSGLIKGPGPRDEQEAALRAGRDPDRCRALLARMAAAPVWWTPTLVLDFQDGSFLDADFRRLSTPAAAAACETAAVQIAKAPADLRRRALQDELDDVAAIHAAGVHLLAGTDMPSPCAVPVASLWHELDLLVRAGLSPYEALKTATVEPAAYFGRPDAGTLASGKVADIVLLSADPLRDIGALSAVRLVIKAGRVVR